MVGEMKAGMRRCREDERRDEKRRDDEWMDEAM